jgi:hypothetical protein
MLTNTELEALKTNFNNFQRRDDMSSMTQAELECWIGQYERLYKKHVMLAEVKAKGKVVKVLRTDLDNIRVEINLIEKKLKKKRLRQNIWKKRTDYSRATTR